MRILLVEDDPILALIAASTLEEEGHQIIGPAYGDQQTLALAESQNADTALIDINLAGYEKARNLHQRYGIASVFIGQLEAARKNADAALGLLRRLCELVINAIKHGGVNRVNLAVRQLEPGIAQICVADQGCGFSEADLASKTSRSGAKGMGLVDALAHSCQATVTRSNNNGAQVSIRFPY